MTEIQKRIARIHAQFVLQYVQKLNCPQWQKEKLVDAVIDAVGKQAQQKNCTIHLARQSEE